MSGDDLKRCLTEIGVKQIELARMLNMSQQGLSAILQSKDIKSGTLEKIAEVLDKDMSLFYACLNKSAVSNNSVINGINGTNIHYVGDRVVEILESQIAAKDKQIETLMNLLQSKNS